MTDDPVSLALERKRVDELRNAIAATMAYVPAPLTPEQSEHCSRFAVWGKAKGLQLPADPAAVAAFVLEEHARGASLASVNTVLDAVAALHDTKGLPNPVETGIVRAALENVAERQAIVPPHGWTPQEKAEFLRLPERIQRTLAKRERDRERGFKIATQRAVEAIKGGRKAA